MYKRRSSLIMALVGVSLSVTTFFSYRIYQTPRVELNLPTSPDIQADLANLSEFNFWVKRRHTRHLRLSDNLELKTGSRSIPIRLTSISYPSLQPSKVRVGFELVNPDDLESLLKHQRYVLVGSG